LISLDSRFRGNDENGLFMTFYEFVKSGAKNTRNFSLFFFASFAALRETFSVPVYPG